MEKRRGLNGLAPHEKLTIDKSVLDNDSSDALKALREALDSMQDGVLGRYEAQGSDSMLLAKLRGAPLTDLEALLTATASSAQKKTALALLRRLLERPVAVDRYAQTTGDPAGEIKALEAELAEARKANKSL